MGNFRILLLDSEPAKADGLEQLLATGAGLNVVAIANDWWSAVRWVNETHVDLCIMDVSRFQFDGALATHRLRQAREGIRVITLADDHDLDGLERLLRAGINAYILKRKAGTELLPAIEAVMTTGVYLGSRIGEESRH